MVSFGRVDDLKLQNRQQRVRFETSESTVGVGYIHVEIGNSTTRRGATQMNSADAAESDDCKNLRCPSNKIWLSGNTKKTPIAAVFRLGSSLRKLDRSESREFIKHGTEARRYAWTRALDFEKISPRSIWTTRIISAPFTTRRSHGEFMIPRIARVAAVTFPMCGLIPAAFGQDVPGIEICTVEKTMERRTSCLQSNIDFLHKTIARLATDHQQKLDAANRQIEALKALVIAMQKIVDDLRSAQAKQVEETKSKTDVPPAKESQKESGK